jgi:hypothetical protein
MSDIKKKPIEHKIILDNIDDITNINEDIILEIPDETFSEGEELLFEQDENIIYFENVENMEDVDNFDLLYKLNTNKHKQEGKHSLDRDTIFKGKIIKKDEDSEGINEEIHEDDNIDLSNLFDNQFDSNSEDYFNQNNLTKDIYELLSLKTNIDFSQNRRKPNRELFNDYYNMLVKELGIRYTKSELFVELSYYFTDNIFNMFKILDKNQATLIIKELMKKGYLKNLEGIKFI